MKFWKSPIRTLLALLVILGFLASWSWGKFDPNFWLSQVTHLCLLYGGGKITHYILQKFKLTKSTRNEHRLITCLILFLLFDPSISWLGFFLTGVVTELIQRLLRVPTGPLLNPAAAGASIVALFGYYPAWWGVSFAPRLDWFTGGMSIAMLLTLPVAGYVAYRYRKLNIVVVTTLIFIPAYILILQMSPIFVLLEGTLAFFLLVMATEPKTSPVMPNQQLLYGCLLGLLLVMSIKWGWLEPYSMALLVVNLIFNLYKNRKVLIMKAQAKIGK